MSKIYITYETTSTGGESENPNESYSCRSPGYRQLTITNLFKTEPKHVFFFDSLDVEDPKVLECQYVYLVVVRYSDGDTFGTTHGYHKFYSVRATADEALKDKAAIEAPKSKDYKHYREWDGYFSSLEDVEIKLMPLIP